VTLSVDLTRHHTGQRLKDLTLQARLAWGESARPAGGPNDLYTRLGDWVGWLGLAGWIGSMVVQSVSGRRAKKAGERGGTTV